MEIQKKILLKNLKNKIVSSFGENIKDVILFGSQAVGDHTENSDYDILIILKTKNYWQYKDKIRNIICDFEIENDIFIDLKLISEKEQNTPRWYQPVFVNAMKTGIYL